MAMNRVSVLVPLLLSAAALGGCGALAGRAGENGSEGWVSRVLPAGEAARLQAACADLSAYPNDRFFLVREPHGRHSVSVVAHAPPSLQVEVGDEVEILPARCSNGVMPEVKQVFRQ
jgi:hypothetical protein